MSKEIYIELYGNEYDIRRLKNGEGVCLFKEKNESASIKVIVPLSTCTSEAESIFGVSVR